MGLGAVTYILNRDVTPGMLVVTDIDQSRLDRAAELFPPEEYAEKGIDVRFINTKDMADPAAELREISGGTGFDDVLCYAPIPAVYEQAVDILGRDGCLNFFAGPTDTKLKGLTNMYDIHYNSTHIMGTTGGNTNDMLESLKLTEEGRIYPGVMVTHIGGLDCVPETTMNLPNIPGGKKLIYTHTNMQGTLYSCFTGNAALFATVPFLTGSGARWEEMPCTSLCAWRDGVQIYRGSPHHHIYIEDPEKTRSLISVYAAL